MSANTDPDKSTMAQESATLRDAKQQLTAPPAAKEIFPLDALPSDRQDPLWRRIEVDYDLSLPQLAALKNFAVPTPQQQPQPNAQQPQQLTAETWVGLTAMAEHFLARKRTIVLSDATAAAKDSLLDMLNLPETGASWPNKPTNLGRFPGFSWQTSSEDSVQNRTAYMIHLRNNVLLPSLYSMADVQPNRGLLNVEIKGIEDNQRISGTTDVVIAESRNVENKAIKNSVEALIELKKPKNMKSKDHSAQTVAEHLAASYLNRKHGVVSVLTDLNRSWTFYWLAENENGSGVALVKLNLQDEERAAGLAKYILESLNNKTRQDTLPTTFVDRLSFEDAIGRIVGAQNHKRARKDSGGGGGGGGGENSSQAQNGNPAGHGRQSPPPGPSGKSSSSMEFQNNNDAGRDNRTIDMARALLRFAPHSNSDIANELDLLDMVDEAEQYEIVRSFAAKHIVPNMKG